ncbi:MAG: DUF2905 domain-containing protein [Candidatus Omnitrophica bacterium]|nr:DUF2905 domain-containing protein [Candidatus Omnitrophota bacterium]
MQKLLIYLGLIVVLIGVAWPLISKIGLGRLPGDILIKKENFTFYFPLATCILISVIITLILKIKHRAGGL